MYLQSSRSSLQSEIPQNQPSAEAQQPRKRYCPPCIRRRENRSSMTPVFPRKWVKNAGLWKQTEWSRISLTCITRAVCRSSGLRHIRSWHYGSDLRKSHTVNKRGGWLPRLKPYYYCRRLFYVREKYYYTCKAGWLQSAPASAWQTFGGFPCWSPGTAA